MKFVVYSDSDEVIITTKKNEAQTIKEYFVEGERDLEGFDREEINESAVRIRSSPLMVD